MGAIGSFAVGANDGCCEYMVCIEKTSFRVNTKKTAIARMTITAEESNEGGG